MAGNDHGQTDGNDNGRCMAVTMGVLPFPQTRCTHAWQTHWCMPAANSTAYCQTAPADYCNNAN
eukprot:4098524-Lingulodinium_polyedra.AAC.1